MKISDLKKEIRKALEDAGIQDSETESRLIMTEYAGVTLSDMFTDPDREINEAAAAMAGDVVKRRLTGIPLQHIIGRTGFMGFDFKVSPVNGSRGIR